jgi:hypothetical protein
MSAAHAIMSHAVKSMGAGAHGPMNILPSWLAFIWTLVFLAIFVIHARHAHDSTGQRRFWHSGHVLMALGMAFMYAPSSINHFGIPGGFWRFVFAAAMLLILAWVITEALARRAINVLWVVMAIDLWGDDLHVVARRVRRFGQLGTRRLLCGSGAVVGHGRDAHRGPSSDSGWVLDDDRRRCCHGIPGSAGLLPRLTRLDVRDDARDGLHAGHDAAASSNPPGGT